MDKVIAAALVSYLCLAVIAVESAAPNARNHVRASRPVQPVKNSFAMPKMFDFNTFKKSFKRDYGSFSEEIFRRKLFMSRAFDAFISTVNYCHDLLNYHEMINYMSDWTPKEIRSIYLPAKIMLKNSKKSLDNQAEQRQSREPVEIVEAVELDDIEGALKNLLEEGDPNYKEIVSELNKSEEPDKDSLKRSKRHLGQSHMRPRRVSLRPRTRKQQQADSKRSAPETPLPDDSTAGPDSKRAKIVNDGDQQQGSVVNKWLSYSHLPKSLVPPGVLPNATYLKTISKGTSAMLSSISTYSQKYYQTFNGKKSLSSSSSSDSVRGDNGVPMDNVIYYDLRDTDCFSEPLRQGKCGSCYAFATLATFEYAYCRQTGTQIRFSPQYPIDCGQPSDLSGCNGGDMHDLVSPFISKYGLELLDDYPYRTKTDKCPYNQTSAAHKMGYLRPSVQELLEVDFDDWEATLEKRQPMLVNVFIHSKFHRYGGGVDDALDCQSYKHGHTVVLIGSGRENGQEYWLLRNSFGSRWGVGGYWKLNKKANCFMESVGYINPVVFRGQNSLNLVNSNYTGDEIQKRYRHYLEEQAVGALFGSTYLLSDNKDGD